MNRQTDGQKKLCHTDKRQTSYITVYKIPEKCKIKIEKKQTKWHDLDNKGTQAAHINA